MSWNYPRQTGASPAVSGAVWLVAALLAWTVNPVMWLFTVASNGWGLDCTSPADAPDVVPPGCPREGLAGLAAMFMLLVWVLATMIAALVFGAVEGRGRRFAEGRTVSAAFVTVGMPWALIAYAVGNALGRLLPPPA